MRKHKMNAEQIRKAFDESTAERRLEYAENMRQFKQELKASNAKIVKTEKGFAIKAGERDKD